MILKDVVAHARKRITVIPGVTSISIFGVWGAEWALKSSLSWVQVFWLMMASTIMALIALPVVLGITMVLDWLLSAVKIGKLGQYFSYTIVLSVLGLSVGYMASAISSVSGALGGAIIGIVLVYVFDDVTVISRQADGISEER